MGGRRTKHQPNKVPTLQDELIPKSGLGYTNAVCYPTFLTKTHSSKYILPATKYKMFSYFFTVMKSKGLNSSPKIKDPSQYKPTLPHSLVSSPSPVCTPCVNYIKCADVPGTCTRNNWQILQHLAQVSLSPF